MTFVDKRLLKIAKEGSRLCAEEGVAYRATFLGYEPVKNEKYNNITYKFKFRNEEGDEKNITTRQKAFLAKFAYIPVGSKVEITMQDLGEKVKAYDITVLAKPKVAASTQTEVIEEEVIEEEEGADEEVLKAGF